MPIRVSAAKQVAHQRATTPPVGAAPLMSRAMT
jgi:hypothetical protein